MTTDFVAINPATSGTIEDIETQTLADGRQRQVVSMGDFLAALHNAIEQMVNPITVNNNAQVRISIENIAGALTLSTITTIGTVTTVSTVTTVTTVSTVTLVSTVASLTNQAQLGGKLADSMVMDNMMSMWANAIRGRIT